MEESIRSLGLVGIIPYYRMKLGESIGNAISLQSWFRRLVWCFMPFTLVPLVFWKRSIAFFASRKYLVLFFILVLISDFWGIDSGGGDTERQMAPSFLVFYWLLAEIIQHKFADAKWVFPALLACGAIASLHHVYGVHPLPSRRMTLLFTLIAFSGVTLIALLSKYGAARNIGIESKGDAEVSC